MEKTQMNIEVLKLIRADLKVTAEAMNSGNFVKASYFLGQCVQYVNERVCDLTEETKVDDKQFG